MNSVQSLTNVKLNSLTNEELLRTKWALEKFFYTSGTNIALYNASKTRQYQNFQGGIEDAIRAMMLKITDPYTLGQITEELRKVDDVELLARINRAFNSLGLSLIKFFKGGSAGIDKALRWAGNFGGQATLDKLQINATFDLQNPNLILVLADRRNYLITSVDDTTKKWLANLISEAKAERLTNDEIAALIREKAPEISRVRAELIARTEVANAMSLVEMESALQNGIKLWKWVTAHDDRVDAGSAYQICLENEAAGNVEIGKSFPSGHDRTPGHPRCRCSMQEVVPTQFHFAGRTYWVGDKGEVLSVPTLR